MKNLIDINSSFFSSPFSMANLLKLFLVWPPAQGLVVFIMLLFGILVSGYGSIYFFGPLFLFSIASPIINLRRPYWILNTILFILFFYANWVGYEKVYNALGINPDAEPMMLFPSILIGGPVFVITIFIRYYQWVREVIPEKKDDNSIEAKKDV